MTYSELTDQEYVEAIVKPLVEFPQDVSTNRATDEMGILIELTVNREDMGKIIGKEGRTAKAIRTLLRVLGSRQSIRINLKIVEPDGAEVAINETEDSSEKIEPIEQATSVI